MSGRTDLVPALLGVFAVVAAAILVLMLSTWLLSRRHRRRRSEGTAATRTLTMGDLATLDELAEEFRRKADERRPEVWRGQASRERERSRLREGPGQGPTGGGTAAPSP